MNSKFTSRRLDVLVQQLCGGNIHNVSPVRTVANGDKILLRVTACIEDTRKDVAIFKDDTLTLTCGKAYGLLQPALDEACIGLQLFESTEFSVSPSDVSHPAPSRDESLVVTLPTGGAHVSAGQTVQLTYQGEKRLATVITVDDAEETATCDMNDPLAGKTLVVNTTVLEFDVDTTTGRHQQLFPEPSDVPHKIFSLKELTTYNGVRSDHVYISVRGFVYDVTSGASFYGPGGPYGHMAGSDATVALAKFTLRPSALNQPWSSLDESEEETLSNYVKTFQSKYPCVGKLDDAAF